jgi:predicted RNA-binding protein with PUA-like domain
MQAFIGISRSHEFLSYCSGTKSFWCVHSKAQVGDLVLLYFPVAASQRRKGIAQIYRITSEIQKRSHSLCYNYDMGHVETELLLTLQRPVTFRVLKAHPALSQLGAVRRNMQGVTFPSGSDLWSALRTCITEHDERADPLLPSEIS